MEKVESLATDNRKDGRIIGLETFIHCFIQIKDEEKLLGLLVLHTHSQLF